mmetsp:Transcript_9976/g.30709  ORF Transcript_9976/g.30709 Transcript_9976/m.30709 type:complete len:130 (+) Transcript_9976:204-593(+)
MSGENNINEFNSNWRATKLKQQTSPSSSYVQHPQLSSASRQNTGEEQLQEEGNNRRKLLSKGSNPSFDVVYIERLQELTLNTRTSSASKQILVKRLQEPTLDVASLPEEDGDHGLRWAQWIVHHARQTE